VHDGGGGFKIQKMFLAFDRFSSFKCRKHFLNFKIYRKCFRHHIQKKIRSSESETGSGTGTETGSETGSETRNVDQTLDHHCHNNVA
jgi:hypothetical protein